MLIHVVQKSLLFSSERNDNYMTSFSISLKLIKHLLNKFLKRKQNAWLIFLLFNQLQWVWYTTKHWNNCKSKAISFRNDEAKIFCLYTSRFYIKIGRDTFIEKPYLIWPFAVVVGTCFVLMLLFMVSLLCFYGTLATTN